MLRGDVVIKKIHSWNEASQSSDYGAYDVDEVRDDDAEEEVDSLVHQENEHSASVNTSTELPRSVTERKDRETLVLIYSLLFAVSIFTLMCILICFVWCRKSNPSPVSKPLY
ncbi:unnamed protein product [Heligmosomoides polygyrus]|uniref:Syndecan domain-containing protein n=1 Tax=Heligmosomoides polygyrus TaxID=6339 RepID=A0A183FDW9_HELPZ|nr:unnamed protein product [Heligmosomoides polygyrus]